MPASASGIILDACASAARTAEEPIAAYRMIAHAHLRHGVFPRMLAADTGYGSGHFLDWLERQRIGAQVPIIATRDGTGKRPPTATFSYDAASDTCTCPHGKTMHPAGAKMGSFKGGSQSGLIFCYPSRRECAARPIQPDCAPSGIRTVQRSIHQPARDRARAREGTDAFAASTRLRRRVERVFACIEHHDDLHCARLQGLRGKPLLTPREFGSPTYHRRSWHGRSEAVGQLHRC